MKKTHIILLNILNLIFGIRYLVFQLWHFGILAFLPSSTLLNINVSEEVTTAAHFV
jgi:hypothetical protein